VKWLIGAAVCLAVGVVFAILRLPWLCATAAGLFVGMMFLYSFLPPARCPVCKGDSVKPIYGVKGNTMYGFTWVCPRCRGTGRRFNPKGGVR
jgi:hypothetical protein